MGFSQKQVPNVVCIDPGHPSEVGRGTSGKSVSEVETVWLVAKSLKAVLEKSSIKVVMTKSSLNEFVTNKRRAEIANSAHADLLIRLHCDAGESGGFAAFYPSKQGKVNGFVGPSMTVLKESKVAASAFHPSAIASLQKKLKDRGLKTDLQTAVGHVQGALTGSVYSKVPVILVEMCVLQNSGDEKFIATRSGKNIMAVALASGVRAALKALKESR